jgi:putative flippase GtrA
MTGLPASLSPRLLKVVRFILSGGTATFLNVLAIYLLTDFLGLWYILSATLAFILAVATSFVLQKLWTFGDRSTDRLPFQIGTFLTIALWGLLVDLLLVYVAVEYADVHYVLAQLVAGVLIAVQNYFAYAFLFKIRS